MANAKTPSHNVIAAKWILQQLDPEKQSATLDAGALTDLAASRVNEAKAAKTGAQIDKIVGKVIKRCHKIVDKFETPPDPATKKAKPPAKKKSED